MKRLTQLARAYGILAVTMMLFLVLAGTTEGFATARNLRNVLDQQSTVLIVASFLTIAVIAGIFDISVAAVFVATPLIALLVENATGSIGLAVLAALVAGAAMGFFNGVVVARFRINSFIATLATSFMFFGIGYLVSDRALLRPETDEYRLLARTQILGLTSSTWTSLAIVILAGILLTQTRFGRNVFAIGGNTEAARISGVDVAGVQIATFVLLGVSAGIAGVLNSARSLSAQPSDDFSFAFSALTAVIVGGTSIAGGQGAIWRTVVGAFFLAFLSNGFNLHQIDPIWQRLIEGMVILVAVGIDAWTQRHGR